MNWRDRASLQAEQDRDVANALKWWRESTTGEKLLVWRYIQRSTTDSIDELLSRFAQIGMTQVALEDLRQL